MAPPTVERAASLVASLSDRWTENIPHLVEEPLGLKSVGVAVSTFLSLKSEL